MELPGGEVLPNGHAHVSRVGVGYCLAARTPSRDGRVNGAQLSAQCPNWTEMPAHATNVCDDMGKALFALEDGAEASIGVNESDFSVARIVIRFTLGASVSTIGGVAPIEFRVLTLQVAIQSLTDPSPIDQMTVEGTGSNARDGFGLFADVLPRINRLLHVSNRAGGLPSSQRSDSIQRCAEQRKDWPAIDLSPAPRNTLGDSATQRSGSAPEPEQERGAQASEREVTRIDGLV